MHFKGLLYRALNPLYAKEPLSGHGSKLYGGRFNSKGLATLYTSLSPETAIRESNQVGNLQPTMLVCYRADIDGIFDSSSPELLNKYDLTSDQLAADNWRDQMIVEGRSTTQKFAMRLIDDGYTGLLVRSYAHGTTTRDKNLVLWRWGKKTSVNLQVIDDEDRLTYRIE